MKKKLLRFVIISILSIALSSAFLSSPSFAQEKPAQPADQHKHHEGVGSPVSGRVVDLNGRAVPDAEVTLMLPMSSMSAASPDTEGMQMHLPRRTARSGADGAFIFKQAPAGKYLLQVDAPGFARWSREITVPGTQLSVALEAFEAPGIEPAAGHRVTGDAEATDSRIPLARIEDLERRFAELEASAVLSEPETRVRQVEVWVDEAGGEHEEPVPGAKKTVTYRRELVHRRQTISEKIEEALSEDKVSIEVSSAIAVQGVIQTKGPDLEAKDHVFGLGSADITFASPVAQNTMFFADIVGLTGPSPDPEIGGLTLLNSFTSRLEAQNQVNLREAWLRTELFSQKLDLSFGRLDLTNYFDRNAAANDEFTQFLSDALANNQALGLAANGIGAVGIYDSKSALQFRVGVQQSNLQASNLSDSLFSMAEVDYIATPFSLPEGNYRFWVRYDNTEGWRNGLGVSIDQKITPELTLFARYGDGEIGEQRMRFYSGGLQVQNRAVINPGDFWGIGFARTAIRSAADQNLTEGYYNFLLSEKLRFSFHLTHVNEQTTGAESVAYLVPGIRLQAAF